MKQEETNKPTENGTNVNIIYLTTKCNLDCSYCYEDLKSKEQTSETLENLIKQVDSVIDNEPADKQSLFVLFGGEPTLEWDNIKTLVTHAMKRKENLFFNLETNGIKLLNDSFFKDFLSFVRGKPFSVDVSFDGVGNYLRVDHSGNDSTNQLIEVLNKMNDTDLNWRIRYTITKANYDKFAEDIIKLIQSFSAKRIITSEDSASFSEADYNVINKQKSVLKYLWDIEKIDTPVCNIFCDNCTGCSVSKGNKRYFKNGDVVQEIAVQDNQGEFNHFKDRKIKE